MPHYRLECVHPLGAADRVCIHGAGPNTLVGLAKPADASAPFDHDAAIKALLPAYTQLLTELKGMGVPEAQLHEPILATTDAAKLKAEFTSSYGELSKVGLPINLVSFLPSPTKCQCLLFAHRKSWPACSACFVMQKLSMTVAPGLDGLDTMSCISIQHCQAAWHS